MKDNFSNQADLYAMYRPSYPPELFDFILKHIPLKNCAWDCATGNGQTAIALATTFQKVFATDISPKQLENARKAFNIFYSLQPAEKTNFPENTFDLITISQALHWVQFDKFYSEVNRVAKPDAWLAAWMYALVSISPEIDRFVHRHHYEILSGYWDDERNYVDENYTTVPFPFQEIACPEFEISLSWSLEEFRGYLNTWSALQKFITVRKYNPADNLIEDIKPYWIQDKMPIRFPIHLRMGKIVS